MPEKVTQSPEIMTLLKRKLTEPKDYDEDEQYQISFRGQSMSLRSAKTPVGYIFGLEYQSNNKDDKTSYLYGRVIGTNGTEPKLIIETPFYFDGVSEENIFMYLKDLLEKGEIRKLQG